MYLVDFIYDGIRLSDLGCMVGCIETGVEASKEMGSVISFKTIINRGSYISEIVDANYEDTYTCTFDIFRKPCGNYPDEFSDKEVSWFMRWLNRKEYCKFTPLYDDDHSFYRLYMMGSFNEIKAISHGGNVVGFTLTFISNAPFAFTEYKPLTYKVPAPNSTFTMLDESEELGSIYPKSFKIVCHTSSNSAKETLTISNSMESGRIVQVKNCSNNEIITLDCVHKIITSSNPSHKTLYNDFNYTFPRLINTMKDRKNIFTVSLKSEVTVEYNPIRKVGVV